MDEISPAGITDVWEVRGAQVTTWELDPARYGLAIEDAGALRGGEPGANAERIEQLLADGAGEGDAPGLAAVVLNGGAAIYVAGLARSFEDGLACARQALASGAARAVLDRLRRAAGSATTSRPDG